jgi:hypothetical protein
MRWPKLPVPVMGLIGKTPGGEMPFIVTTGRIRYGKTAMFEGSDTDLTAAD